MTDNAPWQEMPISKVAAKDIAAHLDRIDEILAAEQRKVQVKAPERVQCFTKLPADLRWRIMVLGSSTEDINLWIRRDDPPDGGQTYKLTEIETGVEVEAPEPRWACETYFSNDVS